MHRYPGTAAECPWPGAAADPGMIPLTVPEIRRILAALTARPLPPPLIIHWDAWTAATKPGRAGYTSAHA